MRFHSFIFSEFGSNLLYQTSYKSNHYPVLEHLDLYMVHDPCSARFF